MPLFKKSTLTSNLDIAAVEAASTETTLYVILPLLAALALLLIFFVKCRQKARAVILDEDESNKLNRQDRISETLQGRSLVKLVEGDCSIRVEGEDGYPALIDYEQLRKDEDFSKQIMNDIHTVA